MSPIPACAVPQDRGVRHRAPPTLRRAQILSVGALSWVALLGGVGCGQRSSLSEWKPSDHQEPPSVAPEGQGSAEETGDPTARAAAALWSMRCASCHGEAGRGDGAGKPPGAPVPDFTAASFQSGSSDAKLYETISNGRNLMPAFGKELTKEGIEALIAHVRRLGGAERAP